MGINKRQQRERDPTDRITRCLSPLQGNFCFVLFCSVLFQPLCTSVLFRRGGQERTLQETQDRRSAVVVLKPRSPRVQRVVFFFFFLLSLSGAVCSFVGRGLIDKLYVHAYLLGSCMRVWVLGRGEGEGEGDPPLCSSDM